MRVLLKQILLNPDNPRVKKDADYKRLKTSLAQFPQMLKVRGLGIVDNGDGTYTVLGGNQRRSALSDLERVFGTPDFDKYGADADAVQTLEDYFKNGVPCQDCTNFTEEQRRRFIVTDNLSYAEWDTDAVRAGWSAEEIGAWGSDSILSAWGIDEKDYGTEFTLPEGDKEPFQQMTFTFADEQANEIKAAIAFAKSLDEYGGVMTNGNENSNGNALYLIVSQWAEQKKLL